MAVVILNADQARQETLKEIGISIHLEHIFDVIYRAVKDKEFTATIIGEIARDDRIVLNKMGYTVEYSVSCKVTYIGW